MTRLKSRKLLGEFNAFDHLSCDPFDVPEQAALIFIAERDGDAGRARSCGSTDAMDIRLRLHGKIEVEHMRDAIDVESACGDISRDEDASFPFAKRFKCPNALILTFIAVNRVTLDGSPAEFFHHAISAVLRLGEDECALNVVALKDVHEERNFECLGHAVNRLRDFLNGCRGGRDGNFGWLRQQLLRESLNLLGHRCGEEHGLPLRRQRLCNLPNRLDETHVKHAVSFIENEEGDRAKIDKSLTHEIEQAAWSRHKDIDPASDRPHLWALTDAAEDHSVLQRRVSPVPCEALANLCREFARGSQDERTRASTMRQLGCAAWIMEELMQNRKRERCRLSGASLRDTEQIFACDCRRNRLNLNRCRRFVLIFDERGKQCGMQSERRKCA